MKSGKYCNELLRLDEQKEFSVEIREQDDTMLSGLSVIYLPYDENSVIGALAPTPMNYKEIASELFALVNK
jgi:transcriptional regulator of heat shock response